MATKPKRASAADLAESAYRLKNAAPIAVETLIDVMTDPANSGAVRAQAAGEVLRSCLRYVEQAEIIKRIEALEEAQEEGKK